MYVSLCMTFPKISVVIIDINAKPTLYVHVTAWSKYDFTMETAINQA